MRVTVYDPGKDKVVVAGHICGNIYYREVLPEHFMVKYQGYGIQEELIPQLMSKGVDTIHLFEKATGRLLVSNISQWRYGIRADWNHGIQRFVPRVDMEIK